MAKIGSQRLGFSIRSTRTRDGVERWSVQVRIAGFEPYNFTCDSRTQAEREGSIAVQRLRGHSIPTRTARRMTLLEALNWYDDTFAKLKKENTYYRERRIIAYWRNHQFARRSLINIQSSDIESWIAERLKDHAPNSVRLELTLLSVVFKKARMSLKIEHLENPCQGVERPSVADSARQRVLSRSEKWRIYREALRMSRRQRTHIGQIGAIVRLCLESPLRRQEVTRLCWEQFREVDYNDAMLGKVKVGVIYLKDTKTKTPRAVPLSRQMSNWIKKNRPSADAVGPIFTMPKEWITVAVRTIAARAGVSDVTHHDFKRHSTSRYAEVGIPREMIRAASGTKTDRVLDQHYIVFQGAAVAARILREQELAKRARTWLAG